MNIHDRLTNASASAVAQTAFAGLVGTENERPENQLLGAGLSFLLWCRRYNEDPAEMLRIAGYIFREGLKEQNQHVGALRHFMRVDVSDPYSFCF